jgi:hypothetical protein
MAVPDERAFPRVGLLSGQVLPSGDLEVHLAPVMRLDMNPKIVDDDVVAGGCQPREAKGHAELGQVERLPGIQWRSSHPT